MVGATASALIGVMNPLLLKLSALLEKEYAKLKSIRREVELLQDELSSMNTALEAVSRTEEPSLQVKEWMRQVRELSYDVEDCIDIFTHRLGQQNDLRDAGLFRRTASRLKALRARHCVANQISQLKERAVLVNDRRKRYLVVIDDIWSKSVWQDFLQFIFPENNTASRIITTTRIQDVAKACHFLHDDDHVYVMKSLSSDDSQALFLQRIFGQKEKCPPGLEQVADDILKKCGGMPLAIVNIASLLSTKPTTKQEWVWVLNSIGSTHWQDQGSHELAVVKRILFLSYCDLPHHLKICFLYLSIFPEDYILTGEFLISRWIAEGFLTDDQRGESLEQVGEKYFIELINRNMIQPSDIQPLDIEHINSKAETYQVHDIMLDLIISLSTEENFATILDSQHRAPSSNKIRRFSIQCKIEEEITWLRATNFSHIRSLNLFCDFNKMPPLVNFQVLRVLDLRYYFSLKNEYVDNIGSLSQLRYVRLGNVSKIPMQIGKLQLLQTLDLRGTEVKELPESIVQLLRLVRLFLPWRVKLPNGISKMEALQVLSVIDGTTNSPHIIQELGGLTKLKDLELFWDYDNTESGDEIYNDQLVMSLCKLGGFSLQSLHIQNTFRSSVDFLLDSWSPPPRHLQKFQIDMACYFSSLPKWIPSLSELTCLTISIGNVGGEDLQVLGSLPALLHLDLYPCVPPKQTLKVSCSGFPCLKEFSYGPSPFELALMTYVVGHRNGLGMGLVFEAGAMPKLQKLEFGFNAHEMLSSFGVGLDFGIQHTTSLKHIRIFIDGRDASTWELDAVLAAIANSVTALQNCPVVEMCKLFGKNMANDMQQEETDNQLGT
ncbi:unnamed protein product [Urochloa decumbens]|uniref:Uncharacterized protein n=1 Tax=Urochloa decumbens TaxID=240449 RepID=A0ABC9GSX6_9POAL